MAQMQINMQCRSCSKEYSVPFNGIINVGSDPELHEAARGCVKVDKDWLKKFFA